MSKTDSVIDLTSARARLAYAEAEFAELKAALARGDLITVDEFHALVTDALEHVKAKMLGVCETVAPLAFRATTVAEAEAAIHDAIHAALDELADEADAAMADDGPANDPKPAA